MNKRARQLNQSSYQGGPVIYWMSRDQRAQDNWALLFAQQQAIAAGVPLAVVFCLQPHFLEAGIRQYGFMLRGLAEVEQTLNSLNIPFFLLSGTAPEVLPPFLNSCQAGAIITDFDPLLLKRQWKNQLLSQIHLPVWEVDAHNIIPCWTASAKQEYGAYTLRPKIHRLLPSYLTPIPKLLAHPYPWSCPVSAVNWPAIHKSLTVNLSVPEVTWLQPGEHAAQQHLLAFVNNKLDHYHQYRNDPAADATSVLSPYLHFGQLSAQRAALSVLAARPLSSSAEAFLEELVVRRELADNYCYYNADYTSLSTLPDWAIKTLQAHRHDPRPYCYTLEILEQGQTHDNLWNAAQYQLLQNGIIHGYMRMYWAKKLLEWTAEPEAAWLTAIYLNDKYALDGRDPNGYTGIAWSIGGVHDRPWFERPIFGKIRYMSYNGCKSKFDIKAYITKYSPSSAQSLF